MELQTLMITVAGCGNERPEDSDIVEDNRHGVKRFIAAQSAYPALQSLLSPRALSTLALETKTLKIRVLEREES